MRRCLTFTVMVCAVLTALAQQPGGPRDRLVRRGLANRGAAAPAAPTGGEAAAPGKITFNGAPLDMVFKVYGDLVDKTILKDPQLPNAQITLIPKDGQELSDAEKILAIETVLEMNGVHMEPYGEKFVRALPRKDVRKEGIPLIMDPDHELGDTGRVVSMMINFKNISTEEAQKVLEGLKSATAVLLVFERTNSILVTDTEQNIKRMLDIVRTVDVSTPVNEQVFVRQIKNASAADVKTALEAIVQDSKQEQEKAGGNKAAVQPQRPTYFPQRPGFPGRNNNNNQPAAPVNAESLVMSVSDADRGTIRGKVLILSDERSNKLIIVTSQQNMDFFDKVIEQLDVETTPDTVVKVYRLKYADAEDVSDMINDLIGNASSSKGTSKGNQNQNAKSGTGANMTRNTAAKKPANQRTGEAKAGELSKDNTTVLADKRINGLVVMTNKELVPVVEQIIEAMDIKLSQVLIETVIIEVGLGHDLKTGLDWVHGLYKNSDSTRYKGAIGGGGGDANPVSGGESNTVGKVLIDGATTVLPTIFSPGAAGLRYSVFNQSVDLGAVISMSQGDSNSKYIASPVIMTVDNKEATVEATRSYKFYSGSTSSGGSSLYGTTSYNYSDKDIGIKIKVTPKINPNGTVMLEVEEEYSQIGAKQKILVSGENGQAKDSDVDTALTRKMSADVLLENRQTVVLGGLTETETTDYESGIPVLKDIPYIGKYLFGKTETKESRSELLVFMTPYVLADGDEAEAEALRRKQALSDPRAWNDHGWSGSKLADPVSTKEKLRKQKLLWQKLDEDHKSELELEKARKLRLLEIEERCLREKNQALDDAKELHEREAKVQKLREALEKSRKNAADPQPVIKDTEAMKAGLDSLGGEFQKKKPDNK